MAENPRNPEFPGDMVGRPDDEKELARENFQKFFDDRRRKGQRDRGKTEEEPSVNEIQRPNFNKTPGWQTEAWQNEAKRKSREYWRKVRDTSGKK